MFTVDLDAHLWFMPPMADKPDGGILMTRTCQLPFAPFNGLKLHGEGWEQIEDGHGLELRDVIWDVTREAFRADMGCGCDGMPICSIADELREWARRGWRFGSHTDRYRGLTKRTAGSVLTGDDFNFYAIEEGLPEPLHAMPSEQRPDEFNAFFKALIRALTHDTSDWPTAYAMDQTKGYFGPGWRQDHPSPEPEQRKRSAIERLQRDEREVEYRQHVDGFQSLDSDAKWKWHGRVERYPLLSTFVYKGRQQASRNEAAAERSP